MTSKRPCSLTVFLLVACGVHAQGAPSGGPPGTSGVAVRRLTLQYAEKLALKNNPQITVARLNALAFQQVTRETRSLLLPNATVNLTAVDSHENSRISAGGLNNPIIFERAAVGTTVSQLLTDFGRTTNLLSSSSLRAKAEAQNALATANQITLAADQAFYSVLQAKAVLTVAQQTVNERQVLADQVETLAKNKLKSQLDVSFAQVSLAEAKLLLLDAQNDESASQANLSAVLGFPALQNFDLQDDTQPAPLPPPEIDNLIVQAFNNRPELAALEFEYQAAQKFRNAERDLVLPTISALGAVGAAPVRDDHLTNWYGAVGVNMQIPVFNGFLFSARAQEASLHAQAEQQRLLDLRDRIARDVRTSWLNANNTYHRMDVTQQLIQQASLALDLAQTRYTLGLSSIIELSQAQLQQTQAQISNAQAGYQYRIALAELRYQIAQ